MCDIVVQHAIDYYVLFVFANDMALAVDDDVDC
jgi:hypothetical protein